MHDEVYIRIVRACPVFEPFEEKGQCFAIDFFAIVNHLKTSSVHFVLDILTVKIMSLFLTEGLVLM